MEFVCLNLSALSWAQQALAEAATTSTMETVTVTQTI